MRYPIAIEPGDQGHAYGVVVPDLPGCFSAGDTLDETIANAEEAVLLWIEAELDAGRKIPQPTSIEAHHNKKEFNGWIWAVVTVDLSKLEDKTDRINITLPHRVLVRLDAAAKAAGESRSGYIAKLALGT